MRRWLAGAAVLVALIPIAVEPAYAQTGIPDPARVMKQQMRPGQGVEISEVSRVWTSRLSLRTRRKGVLQFGRSRPVASHYIVQSLDPDQNPTEVIVVDGNTYVGGDDLRIPEGKLWFGRRALTSPGTGAISVQIIDVFRPPVLGALLKGATRERVPGGFRYQGVVTYARLCRAIKRGCTTQFPFAVVGDQAKHKISWRLWTDAEGRLRRLLTNERDRVLPLSEKLTVDTRYFDWGIPARITAPPEDEVSRS